jgi:hypothetical protein
MISYYSNKAQKNKQKVIRLQKFTKPLKFEIHKGFFAMWGQFYVVVKKRGFKKNHILAQNEKIFKN